MGTNLLHVYILVTSANFLPTNPDLGGGMWGQGYEIRRNIQLDFKYCWKQGLALDGERDRELSAQS